MVYTQVLGQEDPIKTFDQAYRAFIEGGAISSDVEARIKVWRQLAGGQSVTKLSTGLLDAAVRDYGTVERLTSKAIWPTLRSDVRAVADIIMNLQARAYMIERDYIDKNAMPQSAVSVYNQAIDKISQLIRLAKERGIQEEAKKLEIFYTPPTQEELQRIKQEQQAKEISAAKSSYYGPSSSMSVSTVPVTTESATPVTVEEKKEVPWLPIAAGAIAAILALR